VYLFSEETVPTTPFLVFTKLFSIYSLGFDGGLFSALEGGIEFVQL